MKNPPSSLFLAAAAALFALSLSSCDYLPDVKETPPKNWLVGSWILDRERTMEEFTKNTVDAESVAGKIATAALQKTVEAVLTPMDKVKYTFTETEYSEKAGSIDGKKRTYKIIGTPTNKQIKTQDDKGIINVYHQDGLNIWFYLRGQEKLKIYLRATNN